MDPNWMSPWSSQKIPYTTATCTEKEKTETKKKNVSNHLTNHQNPIYIVPRRCLYAIAACQIALWTCSKYLHKKLNNYSIQSDQNAHKHHHLNNPFTNNQQSRKS